MAMFNGVNFPMYPISDVQPFTYRDSWTFLELIENFREYINKTIIPGINGQIDTLVNDYQNALDALKAQNDADKSDVQNIINQFKSDIQAIVDTINNKTGMVDVQHITLTDDSWIMTIDPTWPTNLPVIFDVIQDSVGGHSFSVSSKIANNEAFQINKSPNAETIITLTPNSSGIFMLESDFGTNVNLNQFGGVGDGITDNTNAFKYALMYLHELGGGVLNIPAGRYAMAGYVEIFSNISIVGTKGSVITNKIDSATTSVMFHARSYGNVGPRSGVHNILIDGITFEGNFAKSLGCCVIAANRMYDSTFRNLTINEAVANGHNFDLGGCDNILFDNLNVYGKMNGTDSYVESIQIDNSTRYGASAGGDLSDELYDGTPTTNVTLQNSYYDGITIDNVFHGSPTPIGSHAYLDGMPFSGVTIRNNTFKDIVTGAFRTTGGALRIFASNNVTIDGNRFIASNIKDQTSAIVVSTSNTALPFNNVNDSTVPSTITAEYPWAHNHIAIRNNEIVGYNFNGPAAIHIVSINGLNGYDTSISENRIRECSFTQTNGRGIYLAYQKFAKVTNNYMDYAPGLVADYKGSHIQISNNVSEKTTDGSYGIVSTSSTDISIIGNTINDAMNPINVSNGNNVVIANNLFNTASTSNQFIVNNTQIFCVTGNVVNNATDVANYGLYADRSSNGQFVGNVLKGFRSGAYISGTCVNVLQANNIGSVA